MNTGTRYNQSYRNQVHQLEEETQELATTSQTGIRYNMEYRIQVQQMKQEIGTIGKTGIRYNTENRNWIHQGQKLQFGSVVKRPGIQSAQLILSNPCCRLCQIWYDKDKSNNDHRALEMTNCSTRGIPALYVSALQGYQFCHSFAPPGGYRPCM